VLLSTFVGDAAHLPLVVPTGRRAPECRVADIRGEDRARYTRLREQHGQAVGLLAVRAGRTPCKNRCVHPRQQFPTNVFELLGVPKERRLLHGDAFDKAVEQRRITRQGSDKLCLIDALRVSEVSERAGKAWAKGRVGLQADVRIQQLSRTVEQCFVGRHDVTADLPRAARMMALAMSPSGSCWSIAQSCLAALGMP
jgi:hypothetical protein